MSFHPNDMVRRARAAGVLVFGLLIFLISGFYRAQILDYDSYKLQSETNRLRQVPLPAPRGPILDRKGQPIAENVVGYSVSMFGTSEDSLRATLTRLGQTIPLTSENVEAAVRRYRQDKGRPTVILQNASFDVVSVLEEHRLQFPGLIIQSSPRRSYPDSTAVSAFVGYTAEISERELQRGEYAAEGYKQGQQIGKDGLEKQYELKLRGREGSRFVEVDARNRIVNHSPRQDLQPEPGEPLQTNIDLDLQRFVAKMFADSGLRGAVVAIEPQTGAVLAIHSAPAWDPNRFVGGIPTSYWKELQSDSAKPLYNKALRGRYPPGSTFKLATAALGLERGVIAPTEKFPIACSGGMQYGNRYYRCWDKRGHGYLDMVGAIAKSCDVYFYQLGLRLSLEQLSIGIARMGFNKSTGIDLPGENRGKYPDGVGYFNQKYGPRGWSRGLTLSQSIGQGDNAQTVLNMARFYTALATDGFAAKPEIVRRNPERTRILNITPQQLDVLKNGLRSVVTSGTAAASAIKGVTLAGKTGTAQSGRFVNGTELDHAWFAGFAPAEAPKIVVVVMIEFGGHGTRSAHLASAIIEHYLKVKPVLLQENEG